MDNSALSATIAYVDFFLNDPRSPKDFVNDVFTNTDSANRQRFIQAFTELDECKNDQEKKSDVIIKLFYLFSE